MTKEQTIEAAKVMLAWAEGKPVECRIKGCSAWVPFEYDEGFNFDFSRCYYRIKPEPEYRPFKTAEEVMEATKEHGDWIKNNGRYYKIIEITDKGCSAGTDRALWRFSECIPTWTFADGTPFGMLEE